MQCQVYWWVKPIMPEIQELIFHENENRSVDTKDPIAFKTSWEPLHQDGSNFRTHKLNVSDQKIFIKKTWEKYVFSCFFVLMGTAFAIIGIHKGFLEDEFLPGIFFTIGGIIFFGAGVLALIDKNKVTIDLKNRIYVARTYSIFPYRSHRQQGSLNDIYAIQLIDKIHESTDPDGGSSEYTSYDLNIVLQQGERINLMNQGNSKDLVKSAKIISELLNIPVWKKFC